MDNLNIFITGGTTALGRETTRQLTARGHKVTALTVGSQGAVQVRQDGGLPAFSDPFRAGEIKSLLTMAKADVILHLMPQIQNNFPNRKTDWNLNARVLKDGTNAVLEAAQSAGVKFIVFPSYATVYGDTHGEAVTEESALHTPSALRNVAEAEKRVASNPASCILRAGLVYGAGDEGTEALKDALQNGSGLYLGNGHNVQSWIYVADLARAVVLAAEQQPAGQVFNIADDHPATPAEFARALAAGLGVGMPGTLTGGFGLRMMTTETQRELTDLSLRVNSDKAKNTLGWSAKSADFRAGIEQTLLSWRAETPVEA